jgi:hypothetical protein
MTRKPSLSAKLARVVRTKDGAQLRTRDHARRHMANRRIGAD